MNTNDIMLDCESLSVHFDAPIIEIAAVVFDRTTGKTGATFQRYVAIDSAIKSGRVLASTLTWWISQSPRAKQIFTIPDSDKPSLATALMDFSSWCVTVGKGVPRIWAKGPAEDVTWIQHAMQNGGHGLSVPWHHQNVRDVRTIVELAEEIGGFVPASLADVGVAHTALDDAMYQVNLVCAAYKSLQSYNPAERQKASMKNRQPAADVDDL